MRAQTNNAAPRSKRDAADTFGDVHAGNHDSKPIGPPANRPARVGLRALPNAACPAQAVSNSPMPASIAIPNTQPFAMSPPISTSAGPGQIPLRPRPMPNPSLPRMRRRSNRRAAGSTISRPRNVGTGARPGQTRLRRECGECVQQRHPFGIGDGDEEVLSPRHVVAGTRRATRPTAVAAPAASSHASISATGNRPSFKLRNPV
jgi:hypothetical protein